MTLTAKPRSGQAHKKIHASHHKHTKNYLKTYWPYLPIGVIIVFGILIDHYWHIEAHPTRLTAYTYFDVIESSIGLLALCIFLLRHAFAWHRVLVKGEQFATKHPLMDIGLVSITVLGLVLAHHSI
jgi:hypothetical protein